MQSKRFSLNKDDIKSWLKNTLIFLAPVVLAVVASLTQLVPADTKYTVVALWAVNVLIDIIRKWYAQNGVVVKEVKKKK